MLGGGLQIGEEIGPKLCRRTLDSDCVPLSERKNCRDQGGLTFFILLYQILPCRLVTRA